MAEDKMERTDHPERAGEQTIPDGSRAVRPACPNPLVSVVVPIMNVEDYLRQALDSLKAQTLEEMEFILINDGSTDGSLAIMREYAETDGRFIIVDKPNSGYGHTMNTGLDMARGEYVGILEPDDFVEPRMFRRLYEEASAHDLDFVKSDFVQFTVNEDGSLKKRPVLLSPDDSVYNRTLCPEKEKQVFFFPINTWTGIYRREFLDRNHIRHHETPGASFQDNGFWFQTFCLGTRVRFIRDRLYMYRVDNPNASMRSRKKELCITEEYQWIHRWLAEDPELLRKYEKVMYNKKLLSMLLTFSRLEADRKLPYLQHMRDELSVPYEQNLFDRGYLHPLDWQRLDRIMADPESVVKHVDISVVIPVYNAEAYIGRTIQEILFPCITSIEVICVDDGSTDGTPEILRKLAEQDARIRVISAGHAGAGAARNTGMRQATGEYLAFLDADDFYEPYTLDNAWSRAQSDGLDIVVFPSDNYDTETCTYGDPQGCRTELLPGKRPFAGKDIRRDAFRLFVGWAWDKLFRTAWIRQTGLAFAELPSSNDLSFTFAAVAAAGSIDWQEGYPAVHHRIRAGSVSTGRDRTWDSFHDALLELRENLRKLGIYERFERDYVNYCLYFSCWQAATVSEDTGRKILRELKGGWFDDFGITGRPKQYFRHPDHYEALQQILLQSPEEALPAVRDTILHPSAPAPAANASASLPRKIRRKIRTGFWLLRKQGWSPVLRYAGQKLRGFAAKR